MTVASVCSRSPTPIIPYSREQKNSNQLDNIAMIMTCHCNKIISSHQIELTEKVSQGNDEVRFRYKGKKYKLFVPTKGIYFLIKDAQGILTLVKDKTVARFSCCEPPLHVTTPLL
jgi:hypothetical protein